LAEHKKIIVFEGADYDSIHEIAEQLDELKPGDSYVINRLPTIIDLDDVETLSREHVEQWCRLHNLELKQK